MNSITSAGNGVRIIGDQLVKSFMLLTPAEIANIAATRGLTEAQLDWILNANDVLKGKKEETLATYKSITAKGAETGANNALAFSFKNLWVAMKPMLIMAAIAGAAMILHKWFDKLIVTAEEQRDIFNDLQGSYVETKSELSSLGTEIDSVREKLEELNRIESLGGLTADQSKERDELQKTSDELERRIQLLERLEEVKRKGANDAAYKTLQKTSYEVTKTTTLDNGYIRHTTENVGAAEYITHYIDALEDAAERKKRIEDQLASKTDLTLEESARYEEDIALVEAEISEYEQVIGDVITEIQPLLDGITETSGAAYEQKAAIEAAIDAWMDLNDETEDAVANFENAAIAARQIFPNLTSHVANLKAVEENVAGLSDALANFRDDGFVTMDTFSDLAEVFGQFPDEFERFVNVASDSTSTMSEVQSAANALAEAYLESTDFLNSMTEGTTEATIATLKNMGVMNAEEVVTKRLKIAKAAAALEEAGLTDATWSAIKAHFEAADAAEVDMEAIYALRVEQLNAKIAATDFVTATRDTINALYREAIAVGKATEIWQDYAAALQTKRYLELHSEDLTAGQIEYYNQYLKEYQANIQETLGDFEVELDISASVKPTESSGKTAEEIAAERARKAFELEYNAWKYKLDMERITLEEFYDWLGGQDGYQKYFEAQGETLEDFRKYSKEVFDGLRQVHEEYLSYLDFEIERLERQEDSEGAVIAKLSEKRAEVHKLAAALRTYLTAAGMSEIEILSNAQYRSYMDMIHSIEDEVASIQEQIYEENQSNINSLIDLTEEYVKKLAQDEIDALEEQKELYASLLDAKMKMINSSRAEEKYERDKAEKLKDMQKLQERITALGRVGTREALLEQSQLIEELNAKQIELDDLQKDKYIENTEEAFDKAKTDFEKEKDAEIEILKDFIDNNEAVNKAALKRLDTMNADLYDKLEDYASHYTETTKAELLEMWEAATKAAEKYGSVTNASKVYEDGDASTEVQKTINKMRENGQAWARTTDDNVRQQLADDSLKQGKKLQELLGVPVWRDNNGVWWIDSGSGKKELFSVFHTGTPNVGGNATLKQNEVFAKLDKSESVFTAKHVDKIWEVLQAVNPTKWLSSPLSKFTSKAIQKEAPPAPINIEVNTGLELYGKLDDSVMDVLDRHGRDVANLVASKLRR